MKVDFDTILYIVITIVILVVSGLGSRRKKKLQKQQLSDPAGSEPDSYESRESQTGAGNFVEAQKRQTIPDWQQSSSPFERLERILGGEIPQYESMEGESLETTVDEEEQILEEIRLSRLEDEAETVQDQPEEEIIKTEKQVGKGIPGLFENIDEVKKAVIYSEILNRKYN